MIFYLAVISDMLRIKIIDVSDIQIGDCFVEITVLRHCRQLGFELLSHRVDFSDDTVTVVASFLNTEMHAVEI